MIDQFLKASSLFRPEDEHLSENERDRLQLYRLMSLLGATLIPSFGLLYRLSNPEGVNPAWAQYGLAGLFATLFAASYLFGRIRRRYVPLMWGLLYLQMAWITGVGALNRFANEYALAVLLTYASIGVVIELVAQSFRPILWFLTTGFLTAAAGLFLTPAPQTEPSILLGVLGLVALTIGFSVRGRLSIREELTERERDLAERQRKLESLYKATSHLLGAQSREAVSNRIHEVLGEVFDYQLTNTGFVDGEHVVPEKTTTDSAVQVPDPDPQPIGADTASARALRTGETVVVEEVEALNNDIDYGELRSIAGIPVGNHAVIVVGQVEARHFERFNLRLIEVLGRYAALVLGRLGREEQLVEAKEEAEEAARLKSAMLANMSHEIRTPLTPILGFAESLSERLEGPDAQLAGRIEKSGRRLQQTLDSVLALSRLEAGTQDLSREPVDLREAAEESLRVLRERAEEEGVSISADLPAEPVEARGDEAALRRIAENLVENAVKFTPEGGRVDVRVGRKNGEALLEVEDTGIGMDPGKTDAFFQAFRQESEGHSREYEGSGLGLSITKRLVEELRGAIEVETEKGQGTCFTVRLPKEPPAQDRPRESVSF